MLIQGYRHSRLMEESQSCLEAVARAGPPEEMLVASRVVEHPLSYRLWEAEHDRLIRTVSAHARLAPQIGALRSAAFGLIHRKALFEYLRKREITGARRHRLFSLFYGARDYASSVVAEHASFIRCSSSSLCTDYLAEQLMRDAAFGEPLQLYEEWYADYFRVFCDVELADTEDERLVLAPLEALKPLLKYRLKQARDSILALPQVPTSVWREVEIRRATGETQKLRRLSVEQRRFRLGSDTSGSKSGDAADNPKR